MIVIDASVALKWVLDEPGAEAADALLQEDLAAPALWLVEAGNALWRRAQRGEISGAEAAERLAELMNAPVTTIAIGDDLTEALALADALRHPVYDCLYLALAIRERSYVVTADRRFHAAIQASPEHASTVRLLGA